MFSLKKVRDQKGFTIVELLIVIVVIGILAALVITTYGGIQGKARDSERQSDLQALQTQIEAFYANNNYYPTLSDLNSSTWRNGDGTTANPANMKNLDEAALQDPSETSSAVTAGPLSGTAASDTNKNVYGYVPSPDGCTDQSCTGYTLTAYLESGKVYTKHALD